MSLKIFEDRGGAVRLPLRLQDKLHALGFQLARRGLDVVAPESDVQLSARPELVAKLKQHHPRIGPGNAEFQPALLFVERLIREQAEAQNIRVKGQRPVLIGHRDTDKLDASDHITSRPATRYCVRLTCDLQGPSTD